MTIEHPRAFAGITPSPAWAFAQYQHLRAALPAGVPYGQQPKPKAVDSLASLADRFEAFVFDAFGVLNSGPRAIPSAARRFRQLQSLGKTVRILSNAATASHSELVGKYRQLGFDITPDQLISSRWLFEQSLIHNPRRGRQGVMARSVPPLKGIDWVPLAHCADERQLDALDGFVLLSTEGWNEDAQSALGRTLERRPRPVTVANPDLVAPRGNYLTLEPGYFAHLLMARCDIPVEFFGKPYAPAFHAALESLPSVRPDNILMVGDTLHTDILGGQAAGMKTLLVTAHGSLQGMNIPDCIAQSGIAPDYIAPAI